MNLGTKVTEYFLSSKGSVWIHISKHFNELPKTVQGCMAKTDTSKYKDTNDIFVLLLKVQIFWKTLLYLRFYNYKLKILFWWCLLVFTHYVSRRSRLNTEQDQVIKSKYDLCIRRYRGHYWQANVVTFFFNFTLSQKHAPLIKFTSSTAESINNIH